MSGSRRWPATAWRELLSLTLPALDEVAPPPAWTLGGGTALALVLHHRVSYDIDVFLEDAGALVALSPQRNRAARAITDTWQEPGHYLKLERDEGEIDFIVAATVTDIPPWLLRFEDRDVRVEAPAEILAKKLRYRGSRFVPRDVFDVLACDRHDPSIVAGAVAADTAGARRAADRIRRIAGRYRATIADEVNPTSSGAELLEVDPVRAAALLEDPAAR